MINILVGYHAIKTRLWEIYDAKITFIELAFHGHW